MDSLRDLMNVYSPKEPTEVLAIKRFIQETYNATSSVGLQGEAIVVTVASAALANTLRFRITDLQSAAETSKRVILRIG